MLERVCEHIHNWFTDPEDIRAGEYAIEGGSMDLPFVLPGQYFRIVGSVMNDGVYLHPATGLADETFQGEIWPMKVPGAVRTLAAEIAAWQEKYGEAMASPYQSESVIGVYSYARSAGLERNAGADAWQGAFKGRLDAWRRLA